MILVVGSTGMVGSEICRRLVERGESVRALVRGTSDQARVRELRDLPVEVVHGDLRDRSSLEAACRGVDTVVTTASSMPSAYVAGLNDIASVDLEGTTALVDAASAAGVRRIVYISLSRNLDVPCALKDAKRAVEAHIRATAREYVILRPACFMEVWLSPLVGFDASAATATVYGDGSRPVSFISAADVAEIAVRAVRDDVARNRVMELGGPEPVTQLEAIAAFERAGGRRFEITHVPELVLEARRREAQDPMEHSIASLMCAVAVGDEIDMHRVLADFPVKLTSVTDYAERVSGRVPVTA